MTGVTYRDAYKLLIFYTMNAHPVYNMIFIIRKLNKKKQFLRTSILFKFKVKVPLITTKTGTTLVIYSLS